MEENKFIDLGEDATEKDLVNAKLAIRLGWQYSQSLKSWTDPKSEKEFGRQFHHAKPPDFCNSLSEIIKWLPDGWALHFESESGKIYCAPSWPAEINGVTVQQRGTIFTRETAELAAIHALLSVPEWVQVEWHQKQTTKVHLL